MMDRHLGCYFEGAISKEISEHCCYKTETVSSKECFSDTCHRLLYAFWKLLRNLLWKRRMLVMLVIVVNLVVTEGSPAHTRHRHLRHTPRTDRFCEHPQARSPPHDHECRRGRVRRDLHHLNLRDAENATTCDYRVCVDKRANRTPQEIHRVFCVESGCLCQEGLFRCTQLTDKVEVWYGLNTATPRMEKVEVEVGCVCAAHHSLQVNILSPGVEK